MHAAVYRKFQGPVSVRDIDRPSPRPDAAIIRVEACGICRSDWHGWMGHDSDVRLPHVPGHELAGTVAEVGSDVTRWQPGPRVTVPFCCGCGACVQCASGHSHICDDYTQPGFTHFGGFAEYVEIRHADVNLVRLPDSMDFVTAASLGCRFATSFRAVVDQGQVGPDDIVVVYGCGGVGLSAIMIASSLGARVVAVDISESQLAKAAECGADLALNATVHDDISASVRNATDGGATVSIDALGSRATCRDSVLSLRKRGRHVQIGLMLGADADPPLPMSAVIGRELSLFGSHGMPAGHYPKMLQWIESGKLNPALLIGARVSLEEACSRLTEMNQFQDVGATIIDRF